MNGGAFRIDLADLTRRAALRVARDPGSQLHQQAVVALALAADTVERYGRQLLVEEPELSAAEVVDRLAAHLRSLLTP